MVWTDLLFSACLAKLYTGSTVRMTYFPKNAGIKANMLWLLSALNDGQTHTQSQICWDWNYPRTTVNTLVKELEQQGYVELIPVAGTRRELYIVLTDAGKAYADSILKPVYDAEEQLFERYSKEHGTDFVHQLNAFSNTMKTFFHTGNYEDRFESPDEEG